MKTALILAGSGARGVIQAGMIKACCELGLEYDALYGSSAGALNGALLHAGQLGDMYHLWRGIRNKDVYSYAPWNIFVRGKGCLYDSKQLLKLIQKTVNFELLQKNPKPFIVNLTNLDSRESESYDMVNIRTTPELLLLASASPPILMPPVEYGNSVYTDGGLTNNYSIIDAVHYGADRLIVLAPMTPEEKPLRTIVDAIDITISTQIWNQLVRELKFVNKLNSIPGFRKIEIIVVSADKPTGIGILDFDIKNKVDWIEYGYRLAMEKLGGLK